VELEAVTTAEEMDLDSSTKELTAPSTFSPAPLTAEDADEPPKAAEASRSIVLI